MITTDAQEIEMDIETAKHKIRLGELVTKLESNPEFIELVLEGYFKNDASRLVMLKADANFQSPEKQYKLDKDIMGISVFGEYLRTQKVMGDMAKESMKEYEISQVAILQEEM